MSLLTQLGIRYPIFLAPMAGVTTPLLASQVSEAGGLGALGLGACDAFQAEAAIRETQQLTSQPFQVNFFCYRSTPLDPVKSRAWCEYLSAHFTQFGQAVPTQLLALMLPLLTHLSYSRLSSPPAQPSSVFTLVYRLSLSCKPYSMRRFLTG